MSDTQPLDQFKPATKNANSHTERGLKSLSNSYDEVGYVAPMTAAADGEILDGSARLETAFDKFGNEAIVIHHDGTKPIVMVRDDIPNAHTPQAKKIAYSANRIAEIDLSWNPLQVVADLQAGINLTDLWQPEELNIVLDAAGTAMLKSNGVANDPNAEWQGMPGFEQEDGFGAIATVKVHFACTEDVQRFSRIVGQTVNENTKYIWYPKQDKENLKQYKVIDEQ